MNKFLSWVWKGLLLLGAAVAVLLGLKGNKSIKQREKEVRHEVRNLDDAGLANLANELIRKGGSKR